MRNSLIIAAMLCIAYGLFLEYGPKPVRSKMLLQSQWQANQYAVEKYARDSQSKTDMHKVVFVGSSLTQRLNFGYGVTCVYNLSLSGDSALTGLGVVDSLALKPSIVFVEINEPERGSNRNLINKTTEWLPQTSSIFYVENKPVNLAINYLSRPKNENEAQVVNETIRRNALAMQVDAYKTLLPSELLNINMLEFKRAVSNLESKGTKVIFFEMPIHPELESLPRAIQIRESFKSNFPHHKLVYFSDLIKGGSIKTVDGVHLLNDEAKIVVSSVWDYFGNVCVAPKF